MSARRPAMLGALVLATVMFANAHQTPPATASPSRLNTFPRLVLWAWERPEDLRWIDPARVGVAFLDRTLYLEHDRTRLEPRRQPLRVSPQTRLMTVVRIETHSPALTETQQRWVVHQLVEAAAVSRVEALQIDYDATTSEREFYVRVLRGVRAALPANMPLSMTALASWCAGDRWIPADVIDEAVPMLFQMGREDAALKELALDPKRGDPACASALGRAIDEPIRAAPGARRVYIFQSRPWTKASERAFRGLMP